MPWSNAPCPSIDENGEHIGIGGGHIGIGGGHIGIGGGHIGIGGGQIGIGIGGGGGGIIGITGTGQHLFFEQQLLCFLQQEERGGGQGCGHGWGYGCRDSCLHFLLQHPRFGLQNLESVNKFKKLLIKNW